MNVKRLSTLRQLIDTSTETLRDAYETRDVTTRGMVYAAIGLVVLGTLYWKIPESKKNNGEGRLDIPGSFFATISLGCIVYALIESGNSGFGHPKVIVPFVAGGVFLISFLLFEHYSSSPMMPLSLFKSRTFSGANFVSALFWAAWSGAIFFIPFNLIQLQGYTAAGVGVAFLPLILALFMFSRWRIVIKFSRL